MCVVLWLPTEMSVGKVNLLDFECDICNQTVARLQGATEMLMRKAVHHHILHYLHGLYCQAKVHLYNDSRSTRKAFQCLLPNSKSL